MMVVLYCLGTAQSGSCFLSMIAVTCLKEINIKKSSNNFVNTPFKIKKSTPISASLAVCPATLVNVVRTSIHGVSLG